VTAVNTIREQIIAEVGRLLDLPDMDYLGLAQWNRTFGFTVRPSRGNNTHVGRRVHLTAHQLHEAFAEAKADDDYTMDWVGR
jgi:hypothetical protein